MNGKDINIDVCEIDDELTITFLNVTEEQMSKITHWFELESGDFETDYKGIITFPHVSNPGPYSRALPNVTFDTNTQRPLALLFEMFLFSDDGPIDQPLVREHQLSKLRVMEAATR